MKLTIQNVTKSFGTKEVLKGVTFEAESGIALGLLGRNGAGKTTSIRIIMGVLPSDEGQILLDGKPIDRESLKIGYLPEERGMYPKKVILEQLIYFGELADMTKQDAKESALRLIKRLGMEEYTNKKLDTLSKGNQQKIQLVATLINDPDIVILDEPFSGLDPVNSMLLKDIVMELIEQNKVVLFSSHQMSYIEEFCENIAIINQGECVLKGHLRDIKKSYDRNKILITSPQLLEVQNYCNSLSDIVNETSVYKDTLLVTIKEDNMKNRLMAALAQKNLDIDQLKVYEPSLNDIFVEYTEDK